jgi:hypothetical protein
MFIPRITSETPNMMLFPPSSRPTRNARQPTGLSPNPFVIPKGDGNVFTGSTTSTYNDDWPPEAHLILSALEAGRASANVPNRRRGSRNSYRARAELFLFSDLNGTDPWVLFTRDLDINGIGFLCQRHIPLGQSGTVLWKDPKDRQHRAYCTVTRCREAVQGWYEGALSFIEK